MISPTVCIEVVMTLSSTASIGKLEEQSFNLLVAYLSKIIRLQYHLKTIIVKLTTRLLIENDLEAIEDKCILVKILMSTMFGLLKAAELWYQYLPDTLMDGGYMSCP